MARRDQLAVVGELALDQPGGEARAAHLERRIALAETQREIAAGADQTLQLDERPAGHDHLLPAAEHLRVGQIAHRQAVRVGGHHAQPVVLRGEQHAGEDRPVVVGARRADHLAQGLAERCRRHGDAVGRRGAQAGVVVDRQGPHAELRATAGDAHVVGGHGHLDLAGAQRADDLRREACREDHAAVALSADGDPELDRQIEVRAGDRQLVTDELEADARQHRERGTAPRRRPSGRGQRLGEPITFATKLHRVTFPVRR